MLRRYEVEHHDGTRGSGLYCNECAALAGVDWPGTIKHVKEATYATHG